MEPSFLPSTSCLPFLKWAGGKRWLLQRLIELIPESYNTYLEPFAGGAALFFAITPEKAIISDTNKELIGTYSALKKNWQAVHRILTWHHRQHSEAHYYKVRSKIPDGEFARAARFIYLNRTCWNGLYRVNKSGYFNVPIGTKTDVLLTTDNFADTSRFLKNAELTSSDFEKQINTLKKDDLVFVDPPYTVKHKFNGFVKYNEHLFAWDDQIRLRDCLVEAKNRGVTVIGTNADHESIWELYQEFFNIEEVKRFSSIAGKGVARGLYPELLIYS